jgi:hypothetical protein
MQFYGTLRPPLWSSGNSSWLQMQRSGFVSRRYQIFWEVASLERGSLSLVSTTKALVERKSTGSGSGFAADSPLSAKVGTNFADKRCLLGLYSSLADWGHGVCMEPYGLLLCSQLLVIGPHSEPNISIQTQNLNNFIVIKRICMRLP